MPDPLSVGFLHVGPPRHGVTRYGRLMADAARLQPGLAVREAVVEAPAPEALRAAARALAAADVVHVQVNADVWGGPGRAVGHLRALLDALAPPVVATLHDVRDGYGPAALARRLWAERRAAAATSPDAASDAATDAASDAGGGASVWTRGRKALRFLRAERQAAALVRLVARRAARVVVCTAEEARRTEALLPDDAVARRRVAVIPHVVEDRPPLPDAADAKAALGLAGRRVVTLLGYVHRRKGHALVVEALPLLPLDATVVFAGAEAQPAFAAALRRRAEALGQAHRLRWTGYLEDAAFAHVLAATDLAACPFERAAASGSLATWIAAGTPVLASPLPLVHETNARAAGAVATFAPHAPEAFAAAARRLLTRPTDAQRAALARLRATLAPAVIGRLHAAFYRAGAG